MSSRKLVYISCDECGKHSEKDEFNINEMREYCRIYKGWKFTKVENGSYWDFCPECYANYKITIHKE